MNDRQKKNGGASAAGKSAETPVLLASIRIANNLQKLSADPYLAPYADILNARREKADRLEEQLTKNVPGGKLEDFASAHEFYGLHFDREKAEWVFREYAPHAEKIFLVGDFSGWQKSGSFELYRLDNEVWEGRFPADALRHGIHYALEITNAGRRLPAFARYVVQNDATKIFTAVVWHPEEPYVFRNPSPPRPSGTLIYESHTGMAQEEDKVGTFAEYREKILPKVAATGYNTLQLMAVMSHPYYGSFGYHVANFFSIAGIFGTPDEFKELVDEAHRLGLRVIIDLVHSHAVKNEVEGLARFDGERTTYFHAGARGEHGAWDSLCFDYGKINVLHFLLSNCRFWLDEYRIDGFRFDGITSMLYFHHGMNKAFTGYSDYFDGSVDEDALAYLTLANRVIHRLRPDALTVAEDVSGLPGLASPEGAGFDLRMAMGVSDMWFKQFDIADENWDAGHIFHELTNRRRDEHSISYVECHDQSIVGGQTAMFRLAGAEMYTMMNRASQSIGVDRAMALHKISRCLTAATGDSGYLCFMGNEFGHPEWVDFPREGNNWSCYYARRQWSLAENGFLRYGELREFDREMLKIFRTPEFYRCRIQPLRIDNLAKIIVFERAGFIFCANLNPEKSFSSYGFVTPGGEYELLLSSDEKRFGGFGMIEPGQHFYPLVYGSGREFKTELSVYIPARTMIILQKISK